MRRTGIVAGYVCALAMASCGSSGPEPGGYVLLDPEARQAGLSLEVGDRAVTSALPVAVSPGTRAMLVGPTQNEPLAVAAGELVYVEGARATVRHLKIGTEIAPGEVRVLGDARAASDLASQVGGSAETTDGEWHLRSAEIFAAIAEAPVPEHLLGVAPIPFASAAAPAARVQAPPAVVAPAARAAVEATPPTVLAAPAAPPEDVTVARVQERLPVSFAPAASCTGVGGTWRGRAYSEPHGAYYDFTLHVREQASGLKGTVVAELWTASTDEVEPPRACSGSQHVKVFESGSGTVDASGAMHFASTSWRVGRHLCGEPVVGYSPDRFDVPGARDATASDAMLRDDAVWTSGLPMKLTRVSCR